MASRKISPKNSPSYGRPNTGSGKGGLGRGLSQILAPAPPITSDRDARLNQTTDIQKSPSSGQGFIPSGADFGPYFVAKADQYYQGPARSTRVKAHQFIPIEDEAFQNWVGNGVMNKDQFYWALRGRIYVRFHKHDTLWVYSPCSLSDYRKFRESFSKGRDVRSLEAFGPHGEATQWPQGLSI